MSPLYLAVIVCVPTAEKEVVRLATPDFSHRAPSGLPMVESVNVTQPLGGPERPIEATVAVNVTVSLGVRFLGLAVRVTVVAKCVGYL